MTKEEKPDETKIQQETKVSKSIQTSKTVDWKAKYDAHVKLVQAEASELKR